MFKNISAKIKNFKKGFDKFFNEVNFLKLAITLIVSQLFSKVVTSLSTDIIMPFINWLLYGTKSLKDLKFNLRDDINVNYGLFIQNICEFFLVSLFFYIILTYIISKIIIIHQPKSNNNENQNNNKIITKLNKLEIERNEILKQIKEILEYKK
ncbi:MscL family protein [Candidatus Phytoplasma pini]|uniref:Large-conductance mechanosensitive channel n=1 Tax=Candidatus Phytoplasma pini TaxID=267362 RepID=A0A559KJ63_9MOLU|nr:MscL family protein [Candidatus Phytoplasma pini]TVY12166.1 Large-conductance mechanosensitive channel [Candidatus Phytoplasma pini]